MSELDDRKQNAFNYGQIHGLKALVSALVQTHPDADLLLKEFQTSSALGLDQIRALPVPHGANRAYRQFCDQVIVTLGRRVRAVKLSTRRRIP